MEQLVTFETAKLAKEAGFDWPVQNKFDKSGFLNGVISPNMRRYGDPSNYNDPCFQDEGRQYTSAPTQSELQKWLREKHFLCVSPLYTVAGYTFNIYNIKTGRIEYSVSSDNDYYMIWETAYDKGLLLSLKLIQKNLQG
jgi:hypothetical protein